MRRVFLSYGHDEYAPLAERLKTDLDAAGLPTWFDADRLQPGGDWERYIEEGLDWASAEPGEGVFVLLMTPHSVRRPDGYCLNELARAMTRELPVVPVMVSTVEPPLSIARLQWLDLRDAPTSADGVYADRLARLRHAIVDRGLDFDGAANRLASRLRPLAFDGEIHPHLERFIGRGWVAGQLDAWLADPDAARVFWVTGGPGSGKTALSAWLTTRRSELVAVHFCQHTNAHKVDAREAATSIAFQLATQLTGYAQRLNALALDSVLEDSDADTLFDDLVVQPLAGLAPDDRRPRIILVDGLDEATNGGTNALTRMLARALPRLPPWLRLFVTSRPNEAPVAVHLQEFEPRPLADAPENEDDLRSYITQVLAGHPDPEGRLADTIYRRSEGSFLYARWVGLETAAGRLDLTDPDALPAGLRGAYLRYFERQFPDLDAYAARQRPVLEAMTAAAVPLPVDEVAVMLGWSEYDEAEILESFGSLVTVRGGTLHAFHLSALEWIDDRARAGPYWASPAAGRRRLAEHAWTRYRATPGAMPPYALAHGAAHLIAAGRADDAARLLMDYRILRPRADRQVDAIMTDLREAADRATDRELAQALDLVCSVLGLAFGILVREPAQLASQLQARLASRHEPLVRALVDQAVAGADVPILRATTAALRQAGDPLTRTFRGVSTDDDDPDLFALTVVVVDESRDIVFTAGESGVGLVWELSTGRLERRLDLNDDGFCCGEYDHAHGRLVLGDWGGGVTVLRLDVIEDPVVAAGDGQLAGLALGPDGRTLWTARSVRNGERCFLQRGDIQALGTGVRSDIAGGDLYGVAVSPDGRTVAVSVGQQVRVAPADDLDTLTTLAGFEAKTGMLTFAPDGRHIAVGLDDGRIALVPLDAPGSVRMLAGHPIFTYSTAVTGLLFIDGGRRLISAGWDAALRVWDTATGSEVGACHTDSKVFGLAVDASQRWALTGPKMGPPRLWDLTRVGDVPTIARHGAGVNRIVGLSALDLTVTGGAEVDGASVRLWRTSDGALVQTLPVQGNLLGLAVAPDTGSLQVLDDGGVSSWSLSVDGAQPWFAPERTADVRPPPEWTWSVCMAPDVVVGIGTGYPDGKFLRWRAPAWRGRTVGRLQSGSYRAALSDDGRLCAVHGHDTDVLLLFDVRSGDVASLTIDDAYRKDTSGLTVSPSGALAAIGTSAGLITIADTTTRTTRVLRQAGGDAVGVLAISGDQTYLVAGTSGGRLELWDLQRTMRVALFCGTEYWSAVWVSDRAERIVAGDAIGGVHFLVRDR